MTAWPSLSRSTTSQRLASAGGAIFIGIGFLVIMGFGWEAGYFGSLLPSLVSMKPITAIAFLQTGLSILLLKRVTLFPSRTRRRFQAGTLALWFMGVITTAQGLWSLSLGGLVLTALTLWGAGALNAKAGERLRAENLLKERKRAEQAQYQLAAIVESSEDAIVGLTLEGAIFSWNRGAGQLLGYSLGEVLGRSISMVAPSDRGELGREVLERIRRGERIERQDTAWVRKGGGRVYLSLSLAPIRDAGGTIIGSSAIARDISDRDRAKEASHLLGMIIESSDDAILRMNLEGTLLGWNQAARDLYGYAPEEILGRSVSTLSPPERTDEIAEILRQVERGNRIERFETVRVAKNGAMVHISLSVSPVRDITGRIIEAMAIARDITDRRRLEKTLHEQEARIEAVASELEGLSRSVARDLRSPLRAVDGFTQILSEDYKDKLDARGLEYLQRTRHACDRMAARLDDLLALDRVTQQEIHREPVDLSAMAQRIAEDLKRALPGGGIEFVIRQGAMAEGDAPLLEIALENLMAEACRSAGGRERARIEFGVSQTNGESVYFVKDARARSASKHQAVLPPSTPPDEDQDALEPAGVGIAAVQRIIHRHGGKVWAEEEAERGATFYFTL